MRSLVVILVVLHALLHFGCGHYVNPGSAADFEALGLTRADVDRASDLGVVREFERLPLATLPVTIGVARVQGPGYLARRGPRTIGGDHVLLRNPESERLVETLTELPQIEGVATLSPLLLPGGNLTQASIRRCAARLQVQMVLIYTIETLDHGEQHLPFWSLLTLGILPSYEARIASVASAVLVDTRTGFVYGAAEGAGESSRLTSAWSQGRASRRAQDRADRAALEDLMGNIQPMWLGVVERWRERSRKPNSS